MSAPEPWEPIAVIGAACRAAGAETPRELGDVVRRGSCEITEVTEDRWRTSDFYDPAPGPGTSVSRWSGQVPDPYAFDADFFQIPRAEAAHMDPQQRLVLEESWHCVEDSGVPVRTLQEATTDVFVGVASRDHLQHRLPIREVTERTTFGGSDYMLANRVSHALGLQGASFALDAACASSLVTLHLGIRSLHLRESDFVLAGGVCANLHPWKFVSYSRAHMMSPTGRCHALGGDADGFVSADGVVMLMLRRLDDAVAAGDRVLGTIIGSATNSAGRRRSVTAPTAAAQDRLIRKALASGRVDPDTVQYVEMHGTGTPIGDPIEVAAIRSAYGAKRSTPLYLGSVKANIGHTEAAAGGMGVVKVLEMMRTATIPPCAGLGEVNPLLPLTDTLRVPDRAEPWAAPGRGARRRAAVSSFGAGGANAHVLIEEAPSRPASPAVGAEGVPVLVSARSPEAVAALAEDVVEAVAEQHLGDAALTLATGRQAMGHRRGGVAHRNEDAARALSGPTRAAHGRWWLQVGSVGADDGALAGAAADFEPELRQWAREDEVVAQVADEYRAGTNTAATRCLHTMLLLHRLRGLVATVGLRPVGEGWAACAQAAGVLSVADALNEVVKPRSVVGLAPAAVPVSAHPAWPGARPDLITAVEADELFRSVSTSDSDSSRWIVRALEVEDTARIVRHGLARWRSGPGGIGRHLTRDGSAADARRGGEDGQERAGRVLAAAVCASLLEHQSRSAGLQSPLDGDDGAFACLARLLADCGDADSLVSRWTTAEEGTAEGEADRADHPMDVPGRLPVVQAWRAEEAAAARAAALRGPEGTGPHAGRLALVPDGSADADPVVLPWSASRTELLPPLVEAWTRGADVEWQGWFDAGSAGFARTSMPTYPFERVTLRVTEPVVAEPGSDRSARGDAAGARTYELSERWEPIDLPTPAAAPRTLLVTDRRGRARAGALWQAHAHRRLLHCGPGESAPEAVQAVDLTSAEAWTQVLAGLDGEADSVDTVVMLAAGPLEVPHGEPHWSTVASIALASAAARTCPARSLRIVQLLVGDCGPSAEAAYALGPVLRRESGTVSFVGVQADADAQDADLDSAVRAAAAGAAGPRLDLRDGVIRRLGFDVRECERRRELRAAPGVHVITGGAGGLGRVFTRALLACEGVTVVVLGRSDAPPDLPAAPAGSRLEYRSCDLTDAAAVKAACRSIIADLGPIRGVIHAAGVLSDALVAAVDRDDLLRVHGPKCAGIEHLDRATRDQPLDYLVLCSSLATTFGNTGQTAYGFVNACMDAFAVRRNALREAGERHGRSVSVQWPLWEDGAMRLDPDHPLLASGALAPMPAPDGLALLARAIEGDTAEVVRLVHGDPGRAAHLLDAWTPEDGGRTRAAAPEQSREPSRPEGAEDPERLADRFVREAFAGIMSIAPGDLDLGAGIDEHGIDSIHVVAFSRRLEAELGCQEPALLFESRTLGAAAGLLARRHPDALAAWGSASRSGEGDREADTTPPPAQATDTAPEQAAWPRKPRDDEHMDGAVAVLGMAGRYPGAPDLAAFWENLRLGRDSVAPIPADRRELWDRAGRSVESDAAERYCATGGFLHDVGKFDPMFFRISTADAMTMDPQERLLLETSWHALEDAGIPPSSLGDADDHDARAVGVFVGATTATHNMHGPSYWERGDATFPLSMPWSLANRISYCLDLRGPSLAVDTACASSLAALHLAVASLRRGECAVALVGGVNLYLHPWKYDYLSSRQMVSPTGTCSAFGAGADGFVPGEGVGVLVLKALADARRDGDRIRGIVRGTANSHGGRARGYTVPSPQRQASAIRAALQDAGVEAGTVSYVEAHGTGTRLGDPVEAHGIAQALRPDRERPLRLGSVKPQIGHLEGAAGIAGVTKVLLQMQEGTLVPSLNAESPSREIDLGALGLRLVEATAPWNRGADPEGGRLPLRAGVSAFGAGGSNAHVVLEEHEEQASAARAIPGPHAFCLSAGTEAQLGAVCERMADWIRRHPDTGPAVLAYNLQVRREALAHRVAVVADGLPELADALREYADTEQTDAVLVGTRDAGARRAATREAEHLGPHAAPAELARLWADGADLDWASRWEGPQPHLELPLYPFARREVGLPPLPEPRPAASGAAPERPALGSWLRPLERTLTLRSDDPVLSEHQVRGTPILPAVGVLDLILAVARDCGLDVTGVRDLVLAEPVLVTGSLAVTVAFEAADGRRAVAVTSEGPSGRRTHARAVLVEGAAAPRPSRLDFDALERRCATEVAPKQIYVVHDERGLELGGGYRGLAAVRRGASELLADVRRPGEASWGEGQVLHPAVFDSCLQALVTLSEDDILRLPFSVDACDVHAPLPDEVRVHLTLTKAPAGARCFDVAIADPEGEVLVSISGLWVRDVPETAVGAARPIRAPAAPLAAALPGWAAAPRDAGAAVGGAVVVLARQDEAAREFAARLAREGVPARAGESTAARPLADEFTADGGDGSGMQVVFVVPAPSEREALAEDAERLCSQVADILASLSRGRHANARLLAVHRETGTHDPRSDGLAALLRTADAELTRVSAALVRVDPSADPAAAALRMLRRRDWREHDYRVAPEGLRTPAWEPSALPSAEAEGPGLHLVTGGNGAFGRRLVEDLVTRTGSTVVIASRSESGLDELAPSVRASVRHVRADVSTAGGAAAAVAAARAVGGRLDGIFHCAAVLEDEYLLTVTPEAVRRVLAAKVAAAIHLDRASAGSELRVFCLVSSMASAVANPGQSVYGFANGWLNGFARWREQRPDRHGATRALMLPFLSDGGMRIPSERLADLAETSGLRAVTAAEVIDRLPGALAQPHPVVALVPDGWDPNPADAGATDDERDPIAAAVAPPTAEAPPERHRERPDIEAFLIERVAATSRTDPESVDPLSELAVFGLDSLGFARIAGEVGERFGMRVNPAVFFEYTTIRELADHFAALLPQPGPEPRAAEEEASRPVAAHRRSRAEEPDENAVAVIGMAGRFPGSADLDEFWAHLAAGDDLVTEIPRDRWDWRTNYDPAMSRPNTTNSKWGGFIPDIADFDHAFFGISPREARLMDPQHRLFLQIAYQAIEDSGHRPSRLSRERTGVFVGVASHDYFELVRDAGLPLEGYSATGMFHSLLPNRVSYYLNLTGPSFPIDAACSSSLVAVHTAIESLRSGACDTAIVGGANLLISPTIYVAFSRAGMLSPTGRCRTFDQAADGYVRGEGIAAMLLKPLRRAIADGDGIHGVLRGSAVNHGGKVNTLTTPNPNAQAALIETAMRSAGVGPAELDYVEMHGTGTALGDPIEVNGLKRALARLRAGEGDRRAQDLVVGSVKSVVGHLEAAAGMAGLFKVLLAMRHGVIPGNLHLHSLNEHIELEGTGIRIADGPTPWPGSGDHPRTAGISSFGFGGINAHVVVREAVERP